MHLSICNINIPPPPPLGHTPGHLNFFIFSSQFPSPGSEKLFKCPTPEPFFYRVTRQDRFKTDML